MELLARGVMNIALAVEEEQLRSTFIKKPSFFLGGDPFVIAALSQSSELLYSVFVDLKAIKVLFEAIDSILELVLLQYDFTNFPLSKLCQIRNLVKSLRFEEIERLMVDLLTKVDVFELLVQVLDPLVNHFVDKHAGCHKAFPNGFHFADVHSFLRQRHVLECSKFLIYLLLLFSFNLLIIKVTLSKFHCDSSVPHFHVLESHIHLVCCLDCSVLCLLIGIDFSILDMLLFRFIHVDKVVQVYRSLLLLLNRVNGNF